MKQPIVVEKFADNGEHSHWQLVDSETGTILWSEVFEDAESIECQKELVSAKEHWHSNDRIEAIKIVRRVLPYLSLLEAKIYCEKNF